MYYSFYLSFSHVIIIWFILFNHFIIIVIPLSSYVFIFYLFTCSCNACFWCLILLLCDFKGCLSSWVGENYLHFRVFNFTWCCCEAVIFSAPLLSPLRLLPLLFLSISIKLSGWYLLAVIRHPIIFQTWRCIRSNILAWSNKLKEPNCRPFFSAAPGHDRFERDRRVLLT